VVSCPGPSNHGVQLTPLARPWAGRDSCGRALPSSATLQTPASGAANAEY